MRRILTALAGLVTALLLASAPALAASATGTHAWSSHPLTLRTGPGLAYDVNGSIEADLQIKVLRCQKLWCLVDGDGGRGWTDKAAISFGKAPTRWPDAIPPGYPAGNGTVCFYQGANYSDAAYCFGPGRVIRDLALVGLDNSFSSVRIEGSASVAACRDRDFQSYCERIITSQPSLDPYLRRNLSSLRIY